MNLSYRQRFKLAVGRSTTTDTYFLHIALLSYSAADELLKQSNALVLVLEYGLEVHETRTLDKTSPDLLLRRKQLERSYQYTTYLTVFCWHLNLKYSKCKFSVNI